MDIDKTALQYNKVSVCLLAGLSLLWVLLMQAMPGQPMLGAIVVSAVFHCLCSLSYGVAWKAVARRSPEALPKFYLAGSALRLMAAAMVMLVACVVLRHDIAGIRWFAIVFIVFYLAMLIFDAIFFAKVSKNSNK